MWECDISLFGLIYSIHTDRENVNQAGEHIIILRSSSNLLNEW